MHAASCLSSDSESLLEQAGVARGGTAVRARRVFSDEAASHCETLGSRDTSSSGERDGAYESFIVDEASDDSDSDASWVPEE